MNKIHLILFFLILVGCQHLKAQLIQHLDATVEAGIQKNDNNLVSIWEDQSGNSNSASAFTGEVYYYKGDYENEKAWINFGAEQNTLELFNAQASDSWLDQTTGEGGFCVIVAFEVNDIINNWNDLIGNSTAVARGFGLRFDKSGKIQAYLGGEVINKGGEALLAEDKVVFAFNYNATTGSYELWDSKNNSSETGKITNADFSLDSPVTIGAANGDARFFNGFVGEVKIYGNAFSQEEFASERQQMNLKWAVEEYETDAPTPNPASFAIPPKAVCGSLITMTATKGTDLNGPIEYSFSEITGNAGASNSGWQVNPNYRDGDLQPLTQYAYTVKMRDTFGNKGTNSDTIYIQTIEASNSGQENQLEYGAYYGYQGWHFSSGDGRQTNNDWVHWFEGQTPDAASIHGDMWPDLREYDSENLYPTLMKYPNGEVAKVYSSHDYSTIDLHVKWMKDYGIKGCAVQRFTSSIDKPNKLEQGDKKVRDIMTACEKYGVKFWIMHDSGQGDENEYNRITEDWKHLVDDLDILQSPAYTWQNGLPVYGFWGVGVSSRQWTPVQANAILDFYQKGEEKYRTYVCAGVPRAWRINPDGWADVYLRLDMISPWRTIFNNVPEHTPIMIDDFNYCKTHGIDYNPVVSPGASTMHLRDGEHMRNWKPRNGGNFLWSQVYEVCKMGSKFMYVAMFDEVDEGTAMYKLSETADDLPADAFQVPLNEDGYDLPGDWYLQIGTQMQKMLEGIIPLTPELPNAINKQEEEEEEEEDKNSRSTSPSTDFKMYPIPCSDYLCFDGIALENGYQVFDRFGILRMEGKCLSNKINVSNLRQGVYILRIGNNRLKFSKK